MNMNKWILPYLRQYRVLFLLAILLGVLTVLFGGGLMFTSGYLISKASTRPESILMVYVPIVGVRFFGIGRAVLSYIERLTGHRLILGILAEMRVVLYKMIEPQAIFLRERFLTGDLLGGLADDIEHLQDYYLKTLFPSLISLMVYTVIIIFVGTFSLPFAILLAVLIGLLLFVGPLLSFISMRTRNEQLKSGRNQLYQQFTDAVFGMSDWIFSGQYRGYIAKYEEKEQALLELETKKHGYVNWRDLFNQIILGAIVLVVIYWANGMTINGKIPATFIAAFGLVMMSLLESFLPIAGAVSEVSSYQDSVKRLDSFRPDSLLAVNEFKIMEAEEISDLTIQLNNVSFQYSIDQPLLNNLSLTVNQGDKIAILGPSGAGKSTLLKLVQGFVSPSSGNVLLNGRKAEEWATEIPKLLTVLNQKPHLFNTSVLNNIRLGNPEAEDEEVFAAAKRAQIHDLIEQLPEGYNTNMHETGQRFSGGERQRIALARILLQKTPIVIMDEPTVGLDPITEQKLLETIFQALEEKTIIWVTHHLAGMERMKQVYFMDDGKITMSGTHKELFGREERYRKLYSLDRPF